jgi:hypothetical protein
LNMIKIILLNYSRNLFHQSASALTTRSRLASIPLAMCSPSSYLLCTLYGFDPSPDIVAGISGTFPRAIALSRILSCKLPISNF